MATIIPLKDVNLIEDARRIMADGRLNELIKVCLEIEKELEDRERVYKKKIAGAVQNLERVKKAIENQLDDMGVKTAKTDFGTATIRVNESVSCSDDPDAFMDYVMKHGEFELLERRANLTACRDFLEDHGKMPPGVKLNTRRVLVVKENT